ncbi:MAG: hypothetical protein ABWZ66_04435 [Pyrinomonadaceae bacterium]
MPNNKIDDLRNHLFETIEMLKEGDLDLETAKGIAQVAQVIVNVTKLEVDFVKNVAGLGTGFIPIAEEDIQVLRERQFSPGNDRVGTVRKPKVESLLKEAEAVKTTSTQKAILEFLLERGGESRVGVIARTRYETIRHLEILEGNGLISCVERPPKVEFSSEPIPLEVSLNCGIWKLTKMPER